MINPHSSQTANIYNDYNNILQHAPNTFKRIFILSFVVVFFFLGRQEAFNKVF